MVVLINGREFDIYESNNVTYTLQVHDLASVDSVNSSITNSFKAPKTPNNTQILGGLGLVGSTSRIPYTKVETKLIQNGYTVIENGWLKTLQTDDDYNIAVEDGIVDFFKAIENKTIGEHLDLSDVEHDKELASVINSFSRNDYRYIIADYNGLANYSKLGVEYINIDYLVPSINNRWLFDKIFSTFGFTYSGSIKENELFNNLWFTYPKAPPANIDDFEEQEIEPILVGEGDAGVSETEYYFYDYDRATIKFNTRNAIEGAWIDDSRFQVAKSGTYTLEIDINAVATYFGEYRYGEIISYSEYINYFNVFVNNANVGVVSNSSTVNRVSVNAGDIIELKYIFNTTHPRTFYAEPDRVILEITSIDFNISQVSLGVIDFANELISFSIKDYIKEIFWRFALTPFYDSRTSNIHFMTLDERLNNEDVIDWSQKFVRQENQEYTYSNYAQKNFFRHKYHEENEDFNDGYISVENRNLEDEKNLVQSKVYSYSNLTTTLKGADNNIITYVFPIWDKEIKEEIVDDITNIITKYKGLSNRYYFLRSQTINENLKIGSKYLNVENTSLPVSNFPIANTHMIGYAEIIANNYGEFGKVMNDTLIITAKLALNLMDIIHLDFQKIYYIEQLAGYFLLNRVVHKFGDLSEVELIRIKYKD